MSLFSERYQLILDGYNKILNCIETSENIIHLECISNMINSWLNLAEQYCNEVYYDRSDKTRKVNASKLADSLKEMFESIKEFAQQRANELSPEEYEGKWHPVKVYGFDEIGGYGELNSNDDCNDE